MNEAIISVCISVYNAEKYLRRCIDSVIVQRIDAMEIVLVNDGSTDNSSQIMYEYQEKHPDLSIKIIEQANLGLAQGRQTGVDNATGKYITFLDADDFLVDGAYRTILEFMKENEADIYEFQSIRGEKTIKSPFSGVKDSKMVLRTFFQGGVPSMLWLRWYRKELFEKKVFPEGYVIHEDTYALPCLLFAANTIAYICEPLHVYTEENESATTNIKQIRTNPAKAFEDRRINLLSIPYVETYIGKDVLERDYKEPFKYFIARACRYLVLLDVEGFTYIDKIDAIIKTLGLGVSKRELEHSLSRYIRLDRSINYVIRILGIRNTIMLINMKKRIRDSVRHI